MGGRGAVLVSCCGFERSGVFYWRVCANVCSDRGGVARG